VPDTILLVDDEAPVLRTFQEWLAGADLGCDVLSAPDAETALRLANQHPIDLAILDWNLGAGNNGLQLLEDLFVFQPHIVAIMITGHAQQATPLHAMRMGIRDYLDKNSDLHRDSFLDAVRKQLAHLRPAKRERQLHASLEAFKQSVEKILPLVRTSAAVTDPVPFTDLVRSLFRFLIRTTGASEGVLVVRSYQADRQPAEILRAYDVQGGLLNCAFVPFAQSLASAVVSMQEAQIVADLPAAKDQLGVRLQPFEAEHEHVLAAPLSVGSGVNAVLELFDKQGDSKPTPFTESDRQLVSAAAHFGGEMLKQALAESQTSRMLAEAVQAALQASEHVTESLGKASVAENPTAPAPAPVMQKLRQELELQRGTEAGEMLELAELLRVMSVRHGPAALRFALEVLESTDRLLQVATDSQARLPGSGAWRETRS
jgi:DNA-binding NarL/FixJ family response regulator